MSAQSIVGGTMNGQDVGAIRKQADQAVRRKTVKHGLRASVSMCLP